VAFGGAPLGHEFSSLVLALLHVAGHTPKVDEALLQQVLALDVDLEFTTYFSQSCQNCPEVVQALNVLASSSDRVTSISVDGAAFPEEVEHLGVQSVPAVFLNGEVFHQGRASFREIAVKLLERFQPLASPSDVPPLTEQDVVVVGGGPAGVSAAIYAARKGLQTVLVADRLGGQVLDTDSIENLISVPGTSGPRLAADLERHLTEYDVNLLLPHRASRLHESPDGRYDVLLENGAVLRARSVVLAPGANWRTLNVPGEAEYRNKGVTFCPHCDGPLFAGRRVAVVGGGNSGIEAALDLSGIAEHVTVLEFAPTLRADQVLLDALVERRNIDVVVNAQTLAVEGDGRRVTGLRYRDVVTSEERLLDLAGVFVQIGLVPATDWLDGVVSLTPRGEIMVDDRGATSLPGVFAAGDATTAPFKQIVVALGSGATAALSAFESLLTSASLTH
jgi:alkyl hydroperoxide reductase subunit F